MRAIRSTLLTCDAALKQLLLSLEESRPHTQRFVIQDLDETHLLVDSEAVEEIRGLLQEELDKNSWSLEAAQQ